MGKIRILGLILVVISVLLFASCSNKNEQNDSINIVTDDTKTNDNIQNDSNDSSIENLIEDDIIEESVELGELI